MNFGFLNWFRKLEAESRFYPSIAGIFLNGAFLVRSEIFGAIQKHAPQLSGDLLDYGCGSRPYEKLFLVSKYTGVDVQLSGHPNEAKRADIFFDGGRLPVESESFDAVLASEVFEHVFDLPEALTEIRRVLRPKGMLLVTCPFVWPLHEEPYDFARYTPYALRAQLEAAGFEVLVQEKRGSDLEAIAQMASSYFAEAFIPPVPILWRLFSIAYNAFFNLLGIAGRLLPRTGKLYLTNVVLARRI